ncbi:hypothetical protein [Paenibacillus chibensis]|uniref:hypothetical protein n=1 Tax=Paenibacillus chibensis TaxID=59846 RepID=UPI000FDA62E5|nr:hypothetical protein [Paenibacillus chibensis]MEC0370013.1 hypothetical protein [Paenibacillus chibensis]
MNNVIDRTLTGIFVIGLFMAAAIAWLVALVYITQCSLIGGIVISALLLFGVFVAAVTCGGGADPAEEDND